EHGPLARAVSAIRSAKRPVIVAGGGVLYSDASEQLAAFVEATGIPVGTSQAGGGSLVWDHPQYLGGVGATGTAAANAMAAQADVVIGIGTRYSDFTTASRTAFQDPDVTFVNVNVAAFDAYKHGTQLPLIADAREALVALTAALTTDSSYAVDAGYAAEIAQRKQEWDAVVDAAFAPSGLAVPGQSEIIGAVQAATDPRDVVIQAAGSLPGDLHKLWRVRDDLGYHVEYAFSCMGYEIAGGIGVRRGAPDRDAIVMVGDGSYLMLHTELVTAVAEGIKIVVVLIQNNGYASIGHLSETVGSERYGTKYRYLDETGSFENDAVLPVDLAANARSYGVDVIEVQPGPDAIADLTAAVRQAKANDHTTLVHVHSDPLVYAPEGDGWWDVPVAQTSTLPSTQQARAEYEQQVAVQRPLLG
ncbi:MAG: thiamine pyrophosphate-dependent enzyme, partial [Curtobacterium sp.]